VCEDALLAIERLRFLRSCRVGLVVRAYHVTQTSPNKDILCHAISRIVTSLYGDLDIGDSP